MTTQSWLWLAVWNDAKFKKRIYSHSTKHICTQGIILHPATIYLCSFKGLYLFNFKEMIYLLTVKEIHSKNIYLFTKSIIIWGNYIRPRNYIHFKELYQSIQWNYIHSRKYRHSRQTYSFTEIISIQGIYSFKEHIFVQVQGHMFIQGNYIHSTTLRSRKLQKHLFKNYSQPLYDNYKLDNYYLLNKM